MWALKHVYNGLSANSAKNVVDLFKTMFPDGKIAEKIQLEPSKLKCVVNHGVAPYVKEILKNQVIDTVWFAVSFDESLNEVTQTSEMDICLRFWNKENNRVENRNWDSKFLGHTTHDRLKVFDMGKMVQLSMDGQNVNLMLLNKLKEERNEFGSSGLINFSSCNLHIVHCAFKPGAEGSGWNLKNMLKSCFHLLKDTPARRDDFISITESTKFPLQFCATRFFKLFIF